VAPRRILQPLVVFTTWSGGKLAALSGAPATISGNAILVGPHTLVISLECTAAYLIGMYAALVLSQRARIGQKGTALILGVPVIMAANLVRLAAAAHISVLLPAYFDLLHDYLFQGLLVLLVAGLWALWLSEVRPRER